MYEGTNKPRKKKYFFNIDNEYFDFEKNEKSKGILILFDIHCNK